ncbi:DUF423 domain-containing protein [Orrella sp. NBD-18]|uniref:DUF423 domain-containing protein n=1 Tax=Sheuella amnicola TaxID=2707330 RepID=A0A6B2QYZ4_9BURK|nr:DUF423 domain-containing protein [Sheuella amnicola]NDY81947.1 DUF423 domain-containing protein [Sheuella amnicola]HBI84544.1 DUF423 domain-containing protein [Alcaligenaceae bacterium]
MNQPIKDQIWRVIGGILGFTAVLIGAVGAHAMSDAQAAASVERASLYQLIHASVLLFSTLLTGKLASLARYSLFLGIALFSGSIYTKYFFGIVQATKMAPTGGALLMCAWLLLALSGCFAMMNTKK